MTDILAYEAPRSCVQAKTFLPFEKPKGRFDKM